MNISMKNLVAAICIFLIMLGGIIAIDIDMNNRIEMLEDLCSELITQVDNENWTEINAIYSKIEQKWNKDRKIFFLVLNHSDIDNVDFTFVELSSMIESQELPHVKNYAENLKFYISELLDTEEISWENIL